MATSPIITGLTNYVEEHRLPLISTAILKSKSTSIANLQSGVKGPTALNLLGTNVVFGDGSVCGWNESGSTELSQRILTPAALKVNMAFCDKTLLKTWANYEVKVAAGQKTLPFEEDFTNDIVRKVQEGVEKMFYQGQSGSNTEFEGLISILNGASGVHTVQANQGTAAYTFIKNVYANMPEAVIEKDDAAILVSAGLFRQFIQELVSANLYHFEPNDTAGEYYLPGTNCRVIAVNGLNGTDTYDYAIGASLSNIFYGCDMEGDEEKFELWYSQDNREFRLAIEFIAGVQVAYPDEVSFGKLAK